MAAFQFTVDKLGSTVYLWTFTFKVVLPYDEAARRWHHLAVLLRRDLGGYGVRVFEQHVSHGLHVHVLTDQYWNVNRVRILSERAGFGRIHVRRVTGNGRYYIGKYLSKGVRDIRLKGMRLWQTFGGMARCAVRGVVVNSAFHYAYRCIVDRARFGKVGIMGLRSFHPIACGLARRMLWAFACLDGGGKRQNTGQGHNGAGDVQESEGACSDFEAFVRELCGDASGLRLAWIGQAEFELKLVQVLDKFSPVLYVA